MNNMPTENRKHSSAPQIVPTVYPRSQPIEELLDGFWNSGPMLESLQVHVVPPENPLAILEQLGSSPFERGGFPVVGFLATMYEKVSRYALQRR